VANRHKCPSSRMDPDRYIAVNAIRSIDLLDHLEDIRYSIFLNYLFVRGPHPFITETLKEGKCLSSSVFTTIIKIINCA
jgi:hypothetical protein